MANRVIKDSVWRSEKLGRCSDVAHVHYHNIYLLCDDYACFEIDVRHIINTCYESYKKKPKTEVIESWLNEYELNGLLFVWHEDGKAFGYFTGKEEDRLPSPSRRHKRRTPEPPQKELASYLQTYNSLQSGYKSCRHSVPFHTPNPNPNPNPISTLSGKPDASPSFVLDVISFLNEKAERKFNPKTNASIRLIKARQKEGRSLKDFKTVIENKCRQWKDDPEMSVYLRPETLFSATHFESYLNEPINNKKTDDPPIQGMKYDKERETWIWPQRP